MLSRGRVFVGLSLFLQGLAPLSPVIARRGMSGRYERALIPEEQT